MLYPLKFTPLLKERIWGGRKIETVFGKKLPAGKLIGESWELSGVAGDVSVVAGGKLKGNTLEELIEVYMDELVGEKVYEKYGTEFPLLIKLIDADDVLSIQVHPDDKLAAKRHNSYGKTEMWYVIDHEPGAELFVGFNQKVDRPKYIEYLEKGELDKLLNRYKVSKGQAFFIPAGAIHAIGKGMLIAEIQQTSDVTYRVFDWNRKDADGKGRELHTEMALDAIDFSEKHNYDVTAQPVVGQAVNIETCPYFVTNTVAVDGELERNYAEIDSFVIYICLEGTLKLITAAGEETMTKGETVLIPAAFDSVKIEGSGELLEVYLP